MLVKKVKVIL